MAQIIFNTFQLFTDIPFNIWPWLFLVSAPVLIFCAKPHHSVMWRVGRIFLAVVIGYVLINLTLHTHRALDWKVYEQCERNSTHHLGSVEMSAECGQLVNIADGASNVFYLVLGWIPAAAYAGLWELWWRRRYRFIIRKAGEAYKGKLSSTTLIVCSVPVWAFIIFLIVINISKILYKMFT